MFRLLDFIPHKSLINFLHKEKQKKRLENNFTTVRIKLTEPLLNCYIFDTQKFRKIIYLNF